MSTSTDGQICFGVLIEEDADFPWEDEEWDGDIEDWWLRGIHGYKPPFEMFDEYGEWIGGQRWPDEKREVYYRVKREFREAHPLPIELVNYCSAEYPMYIIAIPESCLTANRGYPKEFGPNLVDRDVSNWCVILKHFCKAYGIEYKGDPTWWLSSYWG